MLARCVATLKPPPELTLSQWADRYRMLSAESSAEPGRWHTDKAPYQREIMDAIGDAHIRRVVIMCAAQLGKTELLLNILGYFMAYAPAPILVMQPTLDMGQTFSKDRLAPMIRDTPVLRGLVDVKSRYAGNTILKKNFPGGHITIVGANSATGLASRPIKVLLADEVDRYPGSAGTEGDPLSLAQKRQTTFWDKKTVMVSTPVIKGHSRIETEYNQSTREEWNVPCPECGHYQPFVWANLIFDPDDLQKEIVYKCERCGCVANEYRWKQQSQQGRFVAENPGAETRGFHLNTLASTFCGWKEIVQKFIVAKEQLDQGNPEGMKVWVNTELGETWEERGEQVEDTELFNRREIYDAVVPEEVLVLTAGVDVQDDRFEVEIVGWGVGKESWGIRYQKIYGDMLKEQVWEDLDAFLQTVWCKKDGTALRIISCCIDSGGHHTDQVYRFTKERYERGVWAIKGKGGAEVPYIRNPTTNNRVKTPLFIIGVDAGKALLYQRLRHNTKGPNYYIPEKINDANAYLDGTRMIGVAASVDLPEVNMKTGTVEGFGVGGEIDSPTIGQWESFEQEVQFNTLYSSAVDMLNPLTVVNLTFRAAQQVYDKTGGYDFKGLRVVEMGRVKKFKPGKIEKSEGMEATVTLELTYIMIEVDGEQLIEIDKLNGVYKVKGVDMLAKVRSLI